MNNIIAGLGLGALAAIAGRGGHLRGSDLSIDDIEQFINRLGTYMDVVRPDGDRSILVDTREHGDAYDETPGEQDIQEARRIAKAVRNEFGRDAVAVSLEAVDEWVSVNIRLKDKQ